MCSSSKSYYSPTYSCDGWCLSNCTRGCLRTCGVGCGNSTCTNVCMCSCGNGCGPLSMCGGHCTNSSSCGGSCHIGCTDHCLHSNCSFDCGGDETIENVRNCVGLCSSSSCSATRFRIKMLYKA